MRSDSFNVPPVLGHMVSEAWPACRSGGTWSLGGGGSETRVGCSLQTLCWNDHAFGPLCGLRSSGIDMYHPLENSCSHL